MPKPKKDEKRSDFISRCVSEVTGEGLSQNDALGRCFGIWTNSKKKSFTSIDQLPNDVKVLPTLAQTAWMHIFNSAESLGKKQHVASKEAWAKIRTKWEVGEDGIWRVKPTAKGDTSIMRIHNITSDKGLFKTWIPLDYENGGLKVVEKDAIISGETVKRKFLQGIASNTAIDKENEAVGKDFIRSMQDSALGLNVFLEHDHSLEKTLGTISAVSGDENQFAAETMLEPEEDNENVKTILTKSANGIRLGYSIGGRATEVEKKVNETTGKEYLELTKGQLFEVSVTPFPAGNELGDLQVTEKGGWVLPITKSMKALVDEFEIKQQKQELKKQTKEKIGKFTDLSEAELSKALEEMVQSDEIRRQMSDVWWAFRDAMHSIAFNDDLEADQKAEKLNQISAEFSEKVASMTSELANLIEIIDSELS
jgi:cation transport regulator ChaB